MPVIAEIEGGKSTDQMLHNDVYIFSHLVNKVCRHRSEDKHVSKLFRSGR